MIEHSHEHGHEHHGDCKHPHHDAGHVHDEHCDHKGKYMVYLHCAVYVILDLFYLF